MFKTGPHPFSRSLIIVSYYSGQVGRGQIRKINLPVDVFFLHIRYA
ncbi:hypothetical protein AAGG74_13500 [Bacillus mexicanus]